MEHTATTQQTQPNPSDVLPANAEKSSAAGASVFWAVILTVTKTIVGLATGSLGIVSEALHSSLDLVAAVVTWVAVWVSGKPADDKHHYGHSKIESLSALAELLLLLITCFWIVLEATDRLSKDHPVEVSKWSFIVMVASIGINIWRARDLYRVAEKYNSQALAADALHFSSDVISSLVVIIGLIFSMYGYPKADPIAALGVAVVVGFALIELGKDALNVLMDRAPAGMTEGIKAAVAGVPGVLSVRGLRVRSGGGNQGFADMTIAVARDMAFEEAHGVSHQVEKAIQERYPNCQVTVHIEPGHSDADHLLVRIRRAALCLKGVINLHSLELLEEGECWHVTLHLEVDEHRPLREAHDISSALETTIRSLDPRIHLVTTHLEGARSGGSKTQNVTAEFQDVCSRIEPLTADISELSHFHKFQVVSTGNRFTLEFHVRAPGDISVAQAHKLTGLLEEKIRQNFSQFSSIIIHTEPLRQ